MFEAQGNTMTDTDKKIVWKDHDVLIAVYTLQQEMNRRFDDYMKTTDARMAATGKEVEEHGRTLIRVDGDIAQIKGMFNSLDERLDKQEAKSLWMNVGGYVGVIVATVIAWFKA